MTTKKKLIEVALSLEVDRWLEQGRIDRNSEAEERADGGQAF